MILLDTNVVSAVMQRRPDPAVQQWLDGQALEELWLPAVVVFELRYGLAILPESQRQRRLMLGLDQLLQLIQERIAPLDGLASQKAALLAAERKAKGRPVDLRDTLIAGIAMARGARLATRNTRHFDDTTISLINPFEP
ncbi:type II toxin-antitoxin system VapC family toxin [Cyanobium sp. ATX 6F1]|uniref:type II toxin-antitoxin system VapC family toxin n=1 Tax=unclassified Cyanobium TaxID=2627006 RepID=UPI0020CC1E7C|nr:type II toxin-antitoxin system VapC family toxin [Cyanobium sp. ATX 6F1]